MYPITWENVPAKDFKDKLQADECLVVLTRADKAPASTWIQTLKEKSLPSLGAKHHYLKLHSGFLEQDKGQFPYFLTEWQTDTGDRLERRWLMNHLARVLKSRSNVKKLAVYLPGPHHPEQTVMAEDLYNQFSHAFYKENKLAGFRILVDDVADKQGIDGERGVRLNGHMEYRRWVNENPDSLTSLAMAARLESFAKEHKCGFRLLGREELEKERLNLLLAVGQASEKSPSRLIMLTHNVANTGANSDALMLVGKGITFDTGGINVKHHDSFVNTMKNDMGGAALSAQLFMALVRSGYKRPLVLLIPTCENLVGENSVKPGTIIKTRSGREVFIEHTDAEGRLILSDAISYGHDLYQPALTLSIATLTTACLRQFSGFYTAVHFARSKAEDALREAGTIWGEKFTFWPEFLPFKAANFTSSADLTNLGKLPESAGAMGAAGSSVAAHFLREFAKFPYMHMDIFAATWNWGGDYPGSPYGATGAPFNSLFHWLRHGEERLWS